MTGLQAIRPAWRWLGTAGRTVLLLALVAAGTVLLMRLAPGYTSDSAELDAVHGEAARRAASQTSAREGSPGAAVMRTLGALARGNLGVSRQYSVPVVELLRPRLRRSGSLLLRGLLLGWVLAALGAGLRLAGRVPGAVTGGIFTLLLAVPVGALSTLCLLRDTGGPALVLALVVAARDFQYLDRLVADIWGASPMLYARAAGLSPAQLSWVHLLPAMVPRLGALVPLSVVTALGALLPVEVLFDLPGVAQLAWAAAGNRDLPVLLATTLLLAAVVAWLGGAAAGREPEPA